MRYMRIVLGLLMTMNVVNCTAEDNALLKLQYGRSMDRDGTMIYIVDRIRSTNIDNGQIVTNIHVAPPRFEVEIGDMVPLNGDEFYRVHSIYREKVKITSRIPALALPGRRSESYVLLKKLDITLNLPPHGKITWMTFPPASIRVGNQPTIESHVICTLERADKDAGHVDFRWEAQLDSGTESLVSARDRQIIENFHGKAHVNIGEKFDIPCIGAHTLKAIVDPAQDGHIWVALESAKPPSRP